MGLVDSPASLEQIPAAAGTEVTSFKLMMDYKRRGLMVSDEFLMAALERIAQVGGIAMVVQDGQLVDSPPHGLYLERKPRMLVPA